MSPRLLWKTALFWVVVLLGLAYTTALIPGSQHWSPIVGLAILMPIALAHLWYLNRKKRADPDAFKVSPRAMRTQFIATIAVSVVVAATNFLEADGDRWKLGVAVLSSLAAVLCIYRLFNLPPAKSA